MKILLAQFIFGFKMKDIYERLYKKVQDIAGGVDGIVEIFMMLIKFVNLIFLMIFKLLVILMMKLKKKY